MPCNGRAELGPVTKNVDIASKCREGQGLPVSSSRFMQMKQAGCYLRVVFCPLSALGRASLAVEASTGCEMVTASGVACETHCAIQGTAWTHFRNFFMCWLQIKKMLLHFKPDLGKSRLTTCHLFCPGRGKEEGEGRRGEEGV